MRWLLFSAVVLAGGVAWSAQPEEIWIAASIPFASDSGISDEVQIECDLATQLPIYVEHKAGRKIKILRTESPLARVEQLKEKVLYLEFSSIESTEFIELTEPRYLSISGQLVIKGDVVATFVARQRVRDSFAIGLIGTFGGFSEGTCSKLDRAALNLADKVGKWLRNPTPDAKPGDAR